MTHWHTTLAEAAECEMPATNDQGMPGSPITLCGSTAPFFSQLIQYTSYIALAAAFISGALLVTMIILDKNRGEAGIASSDHSRLFKWGLGVFLITGFYSLGRQAFLIWGQM